MTELLLNAVSGAVGGGVARMVVAPLDLLKIRVQLSGEPLLPLMRDILQREGVLAFWKGNLAAEMMVMPYCAFQFTLYHATRTLVNTGSQARDQIICGASAGLGATLLTYPLDLARTRLATQRASRETFTKALGPPTGWFRGLGPTLWGIVPYAALQFVFYEQCKSRMSSLDEQTARFFAGLISGIGSKGITMPLDVIKKHCQVQGYRTDRDRITHPRGREFRSMFHCAKYLVNQKGWRALYRGSVASLIKAGPNAAVSFVAFETSRDFLRPILADS